MDSAFLISAFVTLFVVIDPVGLSPLFVAMTSGMSPRARRAIAVRACVVAVAILALFGALGESVLGFIGISMPAFRIAGGLLLFLTALDMLFERRTKRREDRAEEAEDDFAHDELVDEIMVSEILLDIGPDSHEQHHHRNDNGPLPRGIAQ